MKIIETPNAPKAVGPYSQAVKSGGFVFTSGQLPIDPVTGEMAFPDIKVQTEQAIRNLAAILESSGSSLEKAVKTVCYLKDINDFAEFNGVYSRYFTSKPARSCIQAAALPKGALIEIEVTAEAE